MSLTKRTHEKPTARDDARDDVTPTAVYSAVHARRHLSIVTDRHHCGRCNRAVRWNTRQRVTFTLLEDAALSPHPLPLPVYTQRYICRACANVLAEAYQSGRVTVAVMLG